MEQQPFKEGGAGKLYNEPKDTAMLEEGAGGLLFMIMLGVVSHLAEIS